MISVMKKPSEGSMDSMVRTGSFRSIEERRAAQGVRPTDSERNSRRSRGEGLRLISDNGSQPTSRSFMKATGILEIEQAFTTYNNPGGIRKLNGSCERSERDWSGWRVPELRGGEGEAERTISGIYRVDPIFGLPCELRFPVEDRGHTSIRRVQESATPVKISS